MSWQKLLAEKRVAVETPSRQEIDELPELAARNFADAGLPGLSTDGKFSMAYNVARSLANAAVRASGYRVKNTGGGHFNTFVAMEVALGPTYAAARRVLRRLPPETQRPVVRRDRHRHADRGRRELLNKSKKFLIELEAWFRRHHSSLWS